MLIVRDLVKIYPGPVAAPPGGRPRRPERDVRAAGPNGAGKTTLMRILGGPARAHLRAGHARRRDRCSRSPSGSGPRLGYLPQEFGFFPHLTGEGMLRYLLRLKGVTGPAGLEAALRRAARAGQPHVRGGPEGEDLLGRHAAAAGDRPGHRRRSPADHRRRADRRPRPRGAAAVLPPALRAGRGPHRAALDPHRRGRGRALPPVRGHPPGPAGRQHHPGRGAAGHRGHDLRGDGPGASLWPTASPTRAVRHPGLPGRGPATASGSISPKGRRPPASRPWLPPWRTPTSCSSRATACRPGRQTAIRGGSGDGTAGHPGTGEAWPPLRRCVMSRPTRPHRPPRRSSLRRLCDRPRRRTSPITRDGRCSGSWALILVLMAWGTVDRLHADPERRRLGGRDEGLDHLRVRGGACSWRS